MSKIRNRSGIGGLISLVALIIVFGTISVAFLDLNFAQSSLMKSGIKVGNIQMDRISENLNFTIQNRTNPLQSTAHYDVSIENLWSEQTTLNSFIIINSTDQITTIQYLNNITIPAKQNMINPGVEKILIFTNEVGAQSNNATKQDKQIIFLTNNGKKCIIPIPENTLGTLWRMC